jgi:hypothetical protein
MWYEVGMQTVQRIFPEWDELVPVEEESDG